MERKAVIVLLVTLGLAGCARTVWVKPGATPESFEADKFDCEAKVQTMYGGQANMNFGHLATYRTDLFRCMRSRGWREQAAQAPIQHREEDYVPPSQRTD